MPLANDPNNTEIPRELNRWNWGAFFLHWIWGIGNSTYIAFLMFVPLVNIVMIFVLGAKGSEWAWRNRVWKDAEHFRSVQRIWAIAGGVSWLAVIGFVFALFFGIVGILKNTDAYQMSMKELRASEQVIERLGAPIEDGIFPTGSVNTKGLSGKAEFQISLTGSKAEGTAISKSVKRDGVWTIELLYVRVAGDERPIIVINTKNIILPKGEVDT